MSFLTTVKLSKKVVESGDPATPNPGSSQYPVYYITITALDESDDPAPVFVYRRFVIDEAQTDVDERDRAFFSNICSPTDWEELPVGIPNGAGEEDVTVFRHNVINAYVRSQAELDFLWDEVKTDVQLLVNHGKHIAGTIGSADEDEVTIS